MSVHSTGPWSLERLPGYGDWDVWINVRAGTVPVIVCEAIRVEADAHLIAAAPELLAALRALVDDCTGGMGTMNPRGFVLDAARAALAKAEGRAL